jgi:hypothetical protein
MTDSEITTKTDEVSEHSKGAMRAMQNALITAGELIGAYKEKQQKDAAYISLLETEVKLLRKIVQQPSLT